MIHVRTTALLLTAALAACGGGGVDTTPIGSFNGATPTPTPAPILVIVAPTPTPGPAALNVSPGTLAFTAATSSAQSIAITEAAYAGAFTESDTCASIATIALTTATGPQGASAVTPVAGGTCVVTFKDAANQTATVAVTVTTSALNVTSHHRENGQ